MNNCSRSTTDTAPESPFLRQAQRRQNSTIYLHYLFFFLMINWSLISNLTLKIDAAMRVPYLLGLIFMISHIAFFLKKKFLPVWVWGVWLAYTFFNTWSIGLNIAAYKYGIWDLLIRISLPFFIFSMTLYLLNRNPRGTIKLIFWSLLVFCSEMIIRSGVLHDFGFIERMINAYGVNANELGLACTVLAWAAMVYERCIKPESKFFLPLTLCAISLIIIRTASRSAFFTFLLLLAIRYIMAINWKKAKTYFWLALLIPVVIISNNYITTHTKLGERLEGTVTDMARVNLEQHPLSPFLGDRTVYYIDGWRIFNQHLWYGVGRDNYILHNSFSNHVCHVEVMSQLAEGGLWGTFLFVVFYFMLYRGAVKKILQPKWNHADIVYMAGLFLVSVINLTSYTSSRYIYFIPLAVCLWYTTSNNDKIEQLLKK